ncbi:MAG: hypothetical protein AB1547_01980, partial [Thermodesulfobacteriota bacterium]
IQRYPAASNTFSQQSQKASPATPLMPGIPQKHVKSDFLRLHHFLIVKGKMRGSMLLRCSHVLLVFETQQGSFDWLRRDVG